jgi:hypothetical protein
VREQEPQSDRRERLFPEGIEAAAFEILSQMPTHKVLGLSRAADRVRDHEDDALLTEGIDDGLRRLAEEDSSRFLEIIAALAEDGSSRNNRDRVLDFLPTVTRQDHELGFRLWHQFVRDSDSTLRSYADDMLGNLSDESLAANGLTEEDTVALRHAYKNAEAGIGVYDPDMAALDKLIEAAIRGQATEEPSE